MILQTYRADGQRAVLGRGHTATGYRYDGVGRLDRFGHNLIDHNLIWDFTRNPAGQIASATRDNDAYAWTRHYSAQRSYETNGLNQYAATASTPAAGQSCTVSSYDPNGNLISDGSTGYLYDAENRLVAASNGAALAYDPLGRLFEAGRNGGITRFLYDGDALVAEYDNGGTLLRRYVHGAGTDEPLIWYEGASVSHANLRPLYADAQGSIVAVSDFAGNSVAVNAYDEYGIPAATSHGRFQYTGQIWLPELGLYHYKARAYSPTLGRFLQTDPIGYDDQFNLYAYVANDPVNHVDPTGTQIGFRLSPFDSDQRREYKAQFNESAATALARAEVEAPVVMATTLLTALAVVVDVANTPVSPGPDTSVAAVAARQAVLRGVRRGGETAATREGRRAHRVYGDRARQEGLRTGRDARLPSGREPDAIDDGNRIVRELKPSTASGIASGTAQLERYVRELREVTGETWRGFLDLYTPFGGRR